MLQHNSRSRQRRLEQSILKAVTPIAGNLGRASENGQFARVGSTIATDKLKKTIQDIDRAAQRKQAKKTGKKRPATKRAAAKKTKQAAPKKSDAQKQTERDAKKQEQQVRRQQEQQTNRDRVLADLQEDGKAALEEMIKNGTAGDDGGLEQRGLAERAEDGSYRLTPAGRSLYAAASSGDQGRANEIASRAQDAKSQQNRDESNRQAREAERATAKQAREDAKAKRRAEVEQRRAEREAKQKEKKGGGGGKTKLTAEQKQAQKEQERSANRQRVAPETGIDPADADDLARSAAQPGTPNNRLIDAGLQNERGEATDAGRRYLSAVERGDVRQAQAALQDARDRREREQERNDRQRIGIPTRRSTGRQNYLAARRNRTRQKASLPEQDSSLSVFKAANGQWRWIIRSGSAFLDRDREIFQRSALVEAAQYNTARGYHGPLRWWHAGEIDTITHKAGSGLDIGDCTFSGIVSRTLVESGTFRNERYALAAQKHAANLKASLGITFRRIDISDDGVYDRFRIVERSLCPADKARNQLSGSLHVFQR